MYCKKCGFELKETALLCPFCNTIVTKEESVVKDVLKEEVVEPEVVKEEVVVNETKPQPEYVVNKPAVKKIKNQLGYLNIKTDWWHHILIACGGYLLMYVLNSLIASVMISYYKSNGMDFSCIPANPDTYMTACPIEPVQAYLKVVSLSQVIAELSVVAIVMFIFINALKPLFKSFKNKKTLKWYGLGLAIMYGGNYLYSALLTQLDLQSTSTNQNAVNEIIFGTPLIGFLFVVVAAPLFEEIIFRFGVFRAFTHKSKKMEVIGIVLTTIIFASVHMIATFQTVFEDPANPNYEVLKSDLLSLPVYLIGAFGLTFAYHKSKSLLTPMLMHMTYNGISFVLILLLNQMEEVGAAVVNFFHLFL